MSEHEVVNGQVEAPQEKKMVLRADHLRHCDHRYFRQLKRLRLLQAYEAHRSCCPGCGLRHRFPCDRYLPGHGSGSSHRCRQQFEPGCGRYSDRDPFPLPADAFINAPCRTVSTVRQFFTGVYMKTILDHIKYRMASMP